jgi:putative endonuclease
VSSAAPQSIAPPTYRRRRDERRGRIAEFTACALLIVKGYRILGRRVRTRVGEIDIIAVRGRRLAFVEVKLRPSLAEARSAVHPRQSRRIARAAASWLAHHRRYTGHEQAFDVVLVAPGCWPRHATHTLASA